MTHRDPWLEHYGERRRAAGGPPRWRGLLALAALALLVGGPVAGIARRDDGWQPPSGVGGFSACGYGGRVAARCIELRVPEDATRPAGRAFALHVAIIPATRRPARGALFYLAGGPGGAASEAAVKVDEVFANVSEYRDIVLVDQRGTGRSNALRCPQEHVSASDARAVAAYVGRCLARFRGRARLFTSASAADDIERVRRALGYGRIDLYGASYGATLAQRYLQRYPGSVRTATLDGASLGNTPVYELAARNAERALRTAITRCHAQRSPCLRTFPEPRAELDRVLARAPASADRVALTIAAMLRTPENAARVPLLIHQAAGGDDEPLRREHASLVGRELDARARLAMVWTILCGEPWARADVAAVARASRGSFLAHAAVARAKLLRQVCAVVTARPPQPRSRHGRPPCPCCCSRAAPIRSIPRPT